MRGALGAALAALLVGAPTLAATPACEAATAAAPFPDEATIRAWNLVLQAV